MQTITEHISCTTASLSHIRHYLDEIQSLRIAESVLLELSNKRYKADCKKNIWAGPEYKALLQGYSAVMGKRLVEERYLIDAGGLLLLTVTKNRGCA